MTLGHLGRHEEALPYKKRALEIRKNKLGNDHPDTAESYFSLSLSQFSVGSYEEASWNVACCLEIRQKSLGDHHPDTIQARRSLERVLKVIEAVSSTRKILKHVREMAQSISVTDQLLISGLSLSSGPPEPPNEVAGSSAPVEEEPAHSQPAQFSS